MARRNPIFGANHRWLALPLGTVLSFGFLFPQGTGRAEVSLVGSTTTFPDSLVIPVEVSGVDNIASMTLTVRFPQQFVSLTEVRRASHELALSVESTVESVPEDTGMALVHITMQAESSVTSGRLMEIVFKPSEKMLEDQKFTIQLVEASLKTDSGQETTDLALMDTDVTVIRTVWACFFYMH